MAFPVAIRGVLSFRRPPLQTSAVKCVFELWQFAAGSCERTEQSVKMSVISLMRGRMPGGGEGWWLVHQNHPHVIDVGQRRAGEQQVAGLRKESGRIVVGEIGP